MSSFVMAASGKKGNILLLRIKRLIHSSNHQNINYSFKSLAYCFLALILALPLTIASYSYNDSLPTALNTKNPITILTTKKREANDKTFLATSKQSIVLSDKSVAKIKNTPLFKKDKSKPKVDVIINNKINTPDYFVDVNHLDSLKQPAAINALNKNIILNNDTYKKALSYQNFKQLEAMLRASGKSITITEDPASKNSYKKLITIEAKDAEGNKNIYKVIVELYQ